jgi:hypothetical protein
MKKGLITLLATVIATLAFAQKNCEGFGQFRKGLKTEMTTYDAKDKVVSVVNQEVIDVKTVGGELVATSKMVTSDKKGKAMGESFTANFKCKDGNIYMNFQDLMGAMPKMEGTEMKVSGDDLMYPVALSVGQTYPDAKMKMELMMQGNPLMKMDFTIKNRKTVAKESITTTAGTYECYKITYTVSSSMRMVGDSDGAIWFSDGMMIKTESYAKKGEKASSTVLTKLVK